MNYTTLLFSFFFTFPFHILKVTSALIEVKEGRGDDDGARRSAAVPDRGAAVDRVGVKLCGARGVLKADSDFSKLTARAAEGNRGANLLLNGAGDLAGGVLCGVAGSDSAGDDAVEIPLLVEGDGSVEVVSIAGVTVVDGGSAGTVLGPLVVDEFALLERGPVGVDVAVHLSVVVDVVIDLGLGVRAFAAGRIAAVVVGPEAVDGHAAGELADAGGQDAAAVVAEGALPGLGENHEGPLVLGLVVAVGVHVAVVA